MSKEITLQDIINSIELPWPEDIFGSVPKEDWAKINEFTKRELGYSTDRIGGDLMRHGWKVLKRQLKDRLVDLEDLQS